MEYEALHGLEPREYFKWFGAVSEIPRGTGNEARFIAFLKDYACTRGLYCETDAAGNVYMRVPATPGYEAEPSILLQAHMDMVCAKEAGVEFDFEREPICLRAAEGKLYAKGTTLGADNGVGLATMLALGDAADIPHPALEFLFTVEEECGLKGIRKFDMTRIHSRRMINMDCGDSHVLCVGCAGRISGRIRQQYRTERIPEDYSCLHIRISGGRGGHSGLMIREGRACAGNLMGELLCADFFSLRLCSMHTSEKPILKECSAIAAFPQKKLEAAMDKIMQRFRQIQSIYQMTDPDLKLEIQACGQVFEGLDEDASAKIVQLIGLLHTGLYRIDAQRPSAVITSSALGTFSLESGLLQADFSIRSTSNAEKALLFEKYKAVAELLNVDLEELDRVPGWTERRESALRSKFSIIHKRLFHTELELERIQGCVETCIICDAIPDMDAIGIAPTARGAHTTQECLYINEVAPYWALVKAILAERCSSCLPGAVQRV